MKLKSVLSVMSFLILFLVSSTTLADRSPLPPTGKNIQVLFTQTAASATLDPHQGKKRWYTLTLRDVNPDVLWFSERPARVSGNMNVTDFVKYWNQGQEKADSFTSDHPNANLVAVSEDKGVSTKMNGVFVLTNPVYDPQQKTLTYHVYSINGDFEKTTNMQNVALFVDSSVLKCWNPFWC